MKELIEAIKQYRKEQAELLDWNKNNGHPVMISYDEGGLNACDKIIAIIEKKVENICESPYKTGFYACPQTSKNCLSCPYVKKQDCPLCGEKMQDEKFCFNPLCRNYDD